MPCLKSVQLTPSISMQSQYRDFWQPRQICDSCYLPGYCGELHPYPDDIQHHTVPLQQLTELNLLYWLLTVLLFFCGKRATLVPLKLILTFLVLESSAYQQLSAQMSLHLTDVLERDAFLHSQDIDELCFQHSNSLLVASHMLKKSFPL